MKRRTQFGLAAALAGLICLPVWAQVQVETDRAQVQVGNNTADETRASANQDHAKHKVQTLRVSELIGLDVSNHENEDLGEIEDLVVDAKTGQIRYAAVSMGGFLGLGDELFAVPWNAIKIGVEDDDPDDYIAVLNVDKQRMENARGFDEDNWPNFGDQTWQRENDKRYQIEVDPRNPDRDINPEIERPADRTPRPNVEVQID